MKAYAMNLRVRGVANSLVRLAAGRACNGCGNRGHVPVRDHRTTRS